MCAAGIDPDGCRDVDVALMEPESGADVEADDGLLAESLAAAEEVLVDSKFVLFLAASLLAMVRFLASALAFAACDRIARLASLSMPEWEPAWNDTKALGAGLCVRAIGSARSSPGDANGLLDTEREVRPLRALGLDIGVSVGFSQMLVICYFATCNLSMVKSTDVALDITIGGCSVRALPIRPSLVLVLLQELHCASQASDSSLDASAALTRTCIASIVRNTRRLRTPLIATRPAGRPSDCQTSSLGEAGRAETELMYDARHLHTMLFQLALVRI